jgi:lipopolysaccharide export system protein LptA
VRAGPPRRRRRGLAAALGVAAALGLAAPAAKAQGLGADLTSRDNPRPVSIEAERGIEWHQNENAYVARGNVKITRGNVTIRGDTVTAFYRPTRAAAAAQGASAGASTGAAAGSGQGSSGQGGGTEIYRVVAEGNVRIATDTQTVYGDRAIYDLDQALAYVTGRDLRLVTPQDVVTARDSLEWYDQRQLAVARGDAVATREQKKVRADVLTAQVVKPAEGPSRISRVDAHGNVLVSTAAEIARGAAGVYNADTGIATLSGGVTITRGDNEMRGQYGVVDLNNNVSRLLAGPPGAPNASKVEGLFVPNNKPPTP